MYQQVVCCFLLNSWVVLAKLHPNTSFTAYIHMIIHAKVFFMQSHSFLPSTSQCVWGSAGESCLQLHYRLGCCLVPAVRKEGWWVLPYWVSGHFQTCTWGYAWCGEKVSSFHVFFCLLNYAFKMDFFISLHLVCHLPLSIRMNYAVSSIDPDPCITPYVFSPTPLPNSVLSVIISTLSFPYVHSISAFHPSISNHSFFCIPYLANIFFSHSVLCVYSTSSIKKYMHLYKDKDNIFFALHRCNSIKYIF